MNKLFYLKIEIQIIFIIMLISTKFNNCIIKSNQKFAFPKSKILKNIYIIFTSDFSKSSPLLAN